MIVQKCHENQPQKAKHKDSKPSEAAEIT